MPAKGRFTRLDAFTKTVEDARVRTTSGGVVTIASLLVMFWLVWGEWADYRRIVVKPELIVDKGRGMCFRIARGGVEVEGLGDEVGIDGEGLDGLAVLGKWKGGSCWTREYCG